MLAPRGADSADNYDPELNPERDSDPIIFSHPDPLNK
jgi:hypothetical protein